MEAVLDVAVPAVLALLALRLCLVPMRLGWKLLVNTGAGFFSLFLLNLIGGYTGILFPINAVSAAIAGFLGLPGIALLAALQLWL